MKVLADPVLGSFELSEFGWFQTTDKHQTDAIRFCIPADGNEMNADALAAARLVWSNINDWKKTATDLIVDDLLETAVEWSKFEPGPMDPPINEICTAESFARSLKIAEFSIEPDGKVNAYAWSKFIGGGHAVQIRGDAKTGIREIALIG